MITDRLIDCGGQIFFLFSVDERFCERVQDKYNGRAGGSDGEVMTWSVVTMSEWSPHIALITLALLHLSRASIFASGLEAFLSLLPRSRQWFKSSWKFVYRFVPVAQFVKFLSLPIYENK